MTCALKHGLPHEQLASSFDQVRKTQNCSPFYAQWLFSLKQWDDRGKSGVNAQGVLSQSFSAKQPGVDVIL